MKISIIIPMLNEAGCIRETLEYLQPYRGQVLELIVVDGGSTDGSLQIAQACSDMVIESERGRSLQMNAGAAVATGDILVFLHADTWMTFNPVTVLQDHAGQGIWGCFSVRLSGEHPLFGIYAWFINLRARLSGSVTGDQAMFVSNRLFHDAGGFPRIPLMEDVEISRRLCKFQPPLCLPETVTTSSRRWEAHGVLRTMVKMWWIRLRYAVGTSPAILAREYE